MNGLTFIALPEQPEAVEALGLVLGVYRRGANLFIGLLNERTGRNARLMDSFMRVVGGQVNGTDLEGGRWFDIQISPAETAVCRPGDWLLIRLEPKGETFVLAAMPVCKVVLGADFHGPAYNLCTNVQASFAGDESLRVRRKSVVTDIMAGLDTWTTKPKPTPSLVDIVSSAVAQTPQIGMDFAADGSTHVAVVTPEGGHCAAFSKQLVDKLPPSPAERRRQEYQLKMQGHATSLRMHGRGRQGGKTRSLHRVMADMVKTAVRHGENLTLAIEHPTSRTVIEVKHALLNSVQASKPRPMHGEPLFEDVVLPQSSSRDGIVLRGFAPPLETLFGGAGLSGDRMAQAAERFKQAAYAVPLPTGIMADRTPPHSENGGAGVLPFMSTEARLEMALAKVKNLEGLLELSQDVNKTREALAQKRTADLEALIRELEGKLQTTSERLDNERATSTNYLRRIAALDTALHGYWEGPAELDGKPDALIERALDTHEAWKGLYHTISASNRITAQMMKLGIIPLPDVEPEPRPQPEPDLSEGGETD